MTRTLVINSGSTSVKLGLYELRRGKLRLQAEQQLPALAATAPLGELQQHLSSWPGEVDLVAHRVVHGGDALTSCARVDASSKRAIERYRELAPLHNPLALHWIEACEQRFAVPQVVVCDTAFFHQLPAVARYYALPAQRAARHGIHRFGFHGLAHESMWLQWRGQRRSDSAGDRVVTVQLGGGCSMAALHGGLPLDTSMGFSPGEGLMMATRCGDLDVEAALYLMQQEGLDRHQLSELLQQHSGLLGVSGLSGDMQLLLQDHSAAASLAVEMFCYRVRKCLGAYAAVLGGLDGVVLGGGIAQHQPLVREKILAGMEWCGIRFDDGRNQQLGSGSGTLSAPRSPVKVLLAVVDENALIARRACEFMRLL